MLLIYNNVQLERQREFFTTILIRITSGKLLPVMDAKVNYRNMRMQATPLNKNEIVLAISATKRGKSQALDVIFYFRRATASIYPKLLEV